MGSVAYYRVGNGLGNIIQTTPAFNYLKKKFDKVIVVTHVKWEEFARTVYKDHTVYVGSANGFKNVFESAMPYDFKEGGTQSEVERNLELVGCKIPRAEDKIGFCGCNDDVGGNGYILLCDGYNKRKNMMDWQVKSYLHWNELVEWLFIDGYDVASIGHEVEYIDGTVNMTDRSLLDTLGLIKRCKLLVTNDTAFYHAACAMNKKCVVIFTMTDRMKNYDRLFHKSAVPLFTELKCQPCQFRGKTHWLTQRPVCHWECRNIPVYTVVQKIREVISG